MKPNDEYEVVASNGDHAHACITVGGGYTDGNSDCTDRIRVHPLVRVAPALCRSDYKGFTRTQNILDGCAYLVVEEVYG